MSELLTQQDSWALAAKFERRLELGRHIDEPAWRWLQRKDTLPKLAFWLELLHRADIDGVCNAGSLTTFKRLGSSQQRRRALKAFEERKLIKQLSEHPEYRVRVLA